MLDHVKQEGGGHPVAQALIQIGEVRFAENEAQEWRTKPEKRAVLEARLIEAGYDTNALNAGAFIEAQVPLATIDRFLCSGRAQLNATLKEIGVRRESAERARKAFDGCAAVAVKAAAMLQIETKL